MIERIENAEDVDAVAVASSTKADVTNSGYGVQPTVFRLQQQHLPADAFGSASPNAESQPSGSSMRTQCDIVGGAAQHSMDSSLVSAEGVSGAISSSAVDRTLVRLAEIARSR